MTKKENSWFKAGAFKTAMNCLVLTSILAVATPAAWAETAAPEQTSQAQGQDDAAALRTRVQQAYEQLRTYQSRSMLTIYHEPDGQRRVLAQYDMRLALDREKKQLRSERPDMTLAITDGRLKLKTTQAPLYYLDMEAPADLSVAALIGALPYIDGPSMPELGLLLGDDASLPASVTPLAQDESGKPGLAFVLSQQARGSMRVDPKTHMVTRIERRMMTPMRGQPQPVEVILDWEITPLNVDQPLGDDALAFDAGNAKATDDLSLVFPHVQGIKAQALKGKAAPAFSLQDVQGKTVDLASLQKKHRVVLLDFWATWCGPCRTSLPILERVQKWIDDENLSAAIYTVNQAEAVGQVRAMWSELSLSLPVLMDTQSKVGDQYGVTALPTMIVLFDGRVHNIHMGLTPNYEQEVRKEITQLLQSQASKPAASL